MLLKKIGKVFFKKRLNAFLNAQLQPHTSQEKLWKTLCLQLQNTEIYKILDLKNCPSYDDYVHKIEPRSYEFYQPFIEEIIQGKQNILFKGPVQYIGLTSGTSGQYKKIPYNQGLLDSFKIFRSTVGSFVNYHLPHSNLMRDAQFKIASAPSNYIENQIPHGYASGILAARPMRFYNAPMYPTPDILEETNWNQQMNKIFAQAKNKDIRILNGIPCYMIKVFNDLLKLSHKKSLSEIWPNIEAFVAMATPLEQYREELSKLMGKKNILFLSAYVATEAPLGIEWKEFEKIDGVQNPSCLFALNVENILYSFSDQENPHKLLSFNELVEGHEYLIYIGAPNGLLQYQIKDKVRLHSKNPFYLFELVGRDGYGINAAGEKMSEKFLLNSFLKAQENFPYKFNHFFVYPRSNKNGKTFYQWFICSKDFDSLESRCNSQLEVMLEENLQKLNNDYYEIRLKDQVLESSRVNFISAQWESDYFHKFKNQGQLKMKTAFRNEQDFLNFWAKTYSLSPPPTYNQLSPT